jgi:hypothetical protein
MAVYRLYNLTGDAFLPDPGDLIRKQMFDRTEVFPNRDRLRRPNSLHCVNPAQGFKAPVIYDRRDGDRAWIEAVKKAVRGVCACATIAFPNVLWGGDGALRFGNPTQGSERCTAAVEMMFSPERCRK